MVRLRGLQSLHPADSPNSTHQVQQSKYTSRLKHGELGVLQLRRSCNGFRVLVCSSALILCFGILWAFLLLRAPDVGAGSSSAVLYRGMPSTATHADVKYPLNAHGQQR